MKFKYYIKQVLFLLNLLSYYVRDLRKYFLFSRTMNYSGEYCQYSLRAAITAHYHVLEKGLCMKDRRDNFGQETSSALLSLLNLWHASEYPPDDEQVLAAHGVLFSYSHLKDISRLPIAKSVNSYLLKYNNQPSLYASYTGMTDYNSQDLINLSSGSFDKLVLARRSIRNFTGSVVSNKVVDEAISLAKNSPSVCNRQSIRVRFINDKELIAECLSYQNGNRGFGHLAGGLCIITADIRSFSGVIERNQLYFDAGLFSMSLMYAFTFLRYGSCPLNWCANTSNNQKLHRLLNIPFYETITMFLVVGSIPHNLKVAQSQRRPNNHILSYIDKYDS